MAIPDFQTLMLPFLRRASDGQEHSMRDAREALAQEFGLNDEECSTLLPSGRQSVFANRVAWAKVYLHRAGLLASPRRGCFQITARGQEVLREPPERITIRWLERFPEFIEFRSAAKRNRDDAEAVAPEAADDVTPEERLESAYLRLRADLAAEILQRVKECSPRFFERLVIELLLAMGYGGSRREAGEAVGGSSDEGIDGIINEDRLGLDVIYLQAKRWEGTVGRPELQKFVGALHGKRARKGIFITTGSFSSEAAHYVRAIEPRVVLVDGSQLAELMIDFGIGVAQIARYEVNRIDSDYFTEE
jgi:restriction system protein